MSSATERDPLLTALASLPDLSPDQARAEKLRLTCRALIQQPAPQLPRALEPAGVASVCLVYAWQILRLVIR